MLTTSTYLNHPTKEILISSVVMVSAFASCWLGFSRYPSVSRFMFFIVFNGAVTYGISLRGPECYGLLHFLTASAFPLVCFLDTERRQQYICSGLAITLLVSHSFWPQELFLLWAPSVNLERSVDALVAVSALLYVVASCMKRVEKLSLQILSHERQISVQQRLLALGEVTSGVAHEINNPLAIILAAIGRIPAIIPLAFTTKSEEALAKFNKTFDTVSKSSQRIAGIVKSMRETMPMGSTEEEVNASVKGLIENALNLCGSKLQSMGVMIDVQTEDGIRLRCRRSEMSQVFLNLINNSADAICNLPKRSITISSRRSDFGIEFDIIDSGNGIPKEICDKIFQPFFNAKPVGQGTGMGLSIARSFVEKGGGKLEYVDTGGLSTVFRITFPLAMYHHDIQIAA